jgi:hypothetical protein
MQGHFRLGRWLPIRAVQVLSPPSGRVWLARIGWGPLSFRGFDRYEEARGEMQWRLLGHVPVMHAEGADVDRSAAGRLAGEAVWTPAAFLDPNVTWRVGGDDTVTAEWALGPHSVSTELRVDAGGRLLAVSIRRWGKPGGDPWGEYPFGGAVAQERAFGGMRIPTHDRGVFLWDEASRQGRVLPSQHHTRVIPMTTRNAAANAPRATGSVDAR